MHWPNLSDHVTRTQFRLAFRRAKRDGWYEGYRAATEDMLYRREATKNPYATPSLVGEKAVGRDSDDEMTSDGRWAEPSAE